MDVPNADSGYGSTGSQHACPSPTNLDKEGRKSGGECCFHSLDAWDLWVFIPGTSFGFQAQQ